MEKLLKIRDFVFKYGSIFLCVCIIALGLQIWKQKTNEEYLKNQYDTLQDETTTYRNKYDQQVAENSAIKVSSAKELKHLGSSKDSTIQRLSFRLNEYQKKARGKVVAAVVTTSVTKDTGTTAVNRIDTVERSPVYYTDWNERWSSGQIRASRDSISRNINVITELDIVVGYQRKNVFSKWKPNVQATNLNPNSTTTTIKSVLVDDVSTRWNLSLGAGAYYDPLKRTSGVAFLFGVNYSILNLYK